jgi:hypothetical protein
VVSILERVEYLGHTVNFKTQKQSYKSHKITYNPPDEWLVFENTQEAIIDESTFMIVQNLRNGRRRPTSMGEPPLFSGLMYCADCGKKMHYHRKRDVPKGHERFFCSAYRQDRRCTAHYIRLDTLKEVVLQNLRDAVSYVSHHESEFVSEVLNTREKERGREHVKVKGELKKAENRVTELDDIIKHLYEDNISGKLTDERFVKLSRDYELEQGKLKTFIEAKHKELVEQEKSHANVKSFIATTKKYTDLKELDAAVLREFISKIFVSEKSKETKIQEIQIVYNFVGVFDFNSATEQMKK